MVSSLLMQSIDFIFPHSCLQLTSKKIAVYLVLNSEKQRPVVITITFIYFLTPVCVF